MTAALLVLSTVALVVVVFIGILACALVAGGCDVDLDDEE